MLSCQILWVLVCKAQTITFTESNVLSAINHYVNTASSLVVVFQHHTIFTDWAFKELTGFCLYWMYTVCGVSVCQEQALYLHFSWMKAKSDMGDECVLSTVKLSQSGHPHVDALFSYMHIALMHLFKDLQCYPHPPTHTVYFQTEDTFSNKNKFISIADVRAFIIQQKLQLNFVHFFYLSKMWTLISGDCFPHLVKYFQKVYEFEIKN